MNDTQPQPQWLPPQQAPAKRPMLSRKRVLIPAALLILFVGVGIGSAGGGNEKIQTTADTAAATAAAPTVTVTETVTSTAAAPAPQTVTVTAAAPAPAPKKEAPSSGLEDDGFVVESLKVEDDGLGDFGGTARIKNNSGQDVDGAMFTITVLDGSDVVASLQGAGNGVKDGGIATVQLISTDSYRKGKFTYDFQVDAAY